MNTDEYYMNKALELAKQGIGNTNPNPLVGAVIVKNGAVIGEGYHKAIGCDHAEVSALKNAREDIKGSTIYVNLEPCSHFGKTPPCINAIIASGIKRVVAAMVDPNPKVSGKGIEVLRQNGIEVSTGILESEARGINEIFIKYITKKRPFVILKAAITLDGKISTSEGDSKWISGTASRQYVHQIRNRVASIMVGINTIVNDNPRLTTRLANKNDTKLEGNDPVRIVVDSTGRIPLSSNVINAYSKAPTLLATTSEICKDKEKKLLDRGIQIIKAEDNRGKVDLNKLMDELYNLNIDSILLEGGGTLNFSALEAGIVDKVMFFIAPKIIGGKNSLTPVEGQGIRLMTDAINIKDMSISRMEEDVLIEGYL